MEMGSLQITAKLREKDIAWIRRVYKRYGKKWNMVTLGKKFGVNHVTIERVIKRLTWKHVS